MTTINYNEFQAGQGVSAPDLNENFSLTNDAIETLETTLNSSITSMTSSVQLKANKNGSSAEKFSVADATENANAVSLSQVNTMLEPLSPVGSVIWYAGSSAPDGYLLCDGSAVSRTTYADLFEIIGVTFGVGDSSTTFNLPKLTDGRFIKGSSSSGTSQDSNIASHTHTTTYNGAIYVTNKYSAGDEHCYAGFGAKTVTSGATGSGSETYPKNLTLLPCIRY